MDPAQQLQRLKVAIEAGRPLPSDVGAWLLNGIEDFEMQEPFEKIKPLCGFLGLRPPGRCSIPYRRRLAERDAALRDALDSIPAEGLSDRQRCAELLSAIRRLQSFGWMRIRTRPIGAYPPGLQSALADAAEAGELPGTVNGLMAAIVK